MKTPQIDDFPLLVARLGKARTDRIRHFQRSTGRRQPYTKNIDNTLQSTLVDLDIMPSAVADILTGAVRSIGEIPPLSVNRLFNLFQCAKVINTREIELIMKLETRQAHRYMQAAKFAYPLLQKHY